MAAVVVVDDLGQVGQAGEEGFEGDVVEARAAVQQHEAGLLTHTVAVGDEAGAFDIHEQPNSRLDFDTHALDPSSFNRGSILPRQCPGPW